MAQENNRKLCWAAHKGMMDGEHGVKVLATELLKHNGDIDFYEKPFFRTAFWEACAANQEPAVKFLLDKGVDVNLADYRGRTPLHEACTYGHNFQIESFFVFLVPDCALPSLCESSHYTALTMWSSSVRSFQSCRGSVPKALKYPQIRNIIEILIEKKAEFKQDKHGQTPLFLSVGSGHQEVTEKLLAAGFDANITDNDGMTCAHIAMFQGKSTQAWELYAKGAWKNRFMIETEGPAGPTGTAEEKPEDKKKDDANNPPQEAHPA